jgi:hypothetical protein
MSVGGWGSELPRKRVGRNEELSEARKLLDDILEQILHGFENSLVSGELENRMAELYRLLRASSCCRHETDRMLLLTRYVHAVRVRVVSLGSRRGLSRVRDELVDELRRIYYILRLQGQA